MLFNRVSLLAFLVLGTLTACEPEEIVPPEPRGVVLLEGRYDMVVRDVVASACDADSGVMRGQVVPAELVREGRGVRFTFAGWALRGEMEPGLLHAEGSVAEPEPVPVDDDEPDDIDYDDGDGDTDTDAGEPDEGDAGEERDDDAPDEGDAGEERDDDAPEDRDEHEGDCGDDRDEHEGGGDCGGEEEPGHPVEPSVRGSALLDARILEPELAEGSLFVSVSGCEVELSVVIGRGGPRGDEPGEPPVYESEDDRGAEEEEAEVSVE